jgi:hypothetical protein
MAALAMLFLTTLLGSAVAVERWRAHPLLLPRPLSTQETRVSPPPVGNGALARVAGMTDGRSGAG